MVGVYIQEIDDKLAKSFGMKKSSGALVSKVLPNSPAEKAKIQQGDVILKFDNQELINLQIFLLLLDSLK